MDIPGYGFVKGASDMRSAIPILFDRIDFRGKDVVEVGPGSGFLTFEMEKRGANVVSIELGSDSDWDCVKHHDQPLNERKKHYRAHVDKVRNGYSFVHSRIGSHAKVVYGTVYELLDLGVTGDIGVITNVLLHLRDPLKAIECLSEVVSKTLIICDVEPYSEGRRMTLLRFLSRKLPIMQFKVSSQNKENDYTWWFLSPKVVEEFVKVLGFTETKTVFFMSKAFGKVVRQWAIIASRSRRSEPVQLVSTCGSG
jgi:hypothetical protein